VSFVLNMTSSALVCFFISASVVTSNLSTLNEFSGCCCFMESFEFNSVSYFESNLIFNIISCNLSLCNWLFVKYTVDK
jgi:hypothetical protein